MNLAFCSFKKYLRLFFVTSILLSSCVKQLDILSPTHITQNVMIGVLHPDSCMKVRIFKTLPNTSQNNNYIGIDNLIVWISENKKEKYILKSIGNGYYSTEIKPKSGHFYNIEAKIDDNITISAQDSVPMLDLPLISLTKPKPENYNSNPDLIITKNIDTKSLWWFSLNFVKNNNNTPQTLLSNSTNLDLFNSKINNIDGRRNYYLITRINPEMPLKKEINIGFVNSIKDVDSAFVYFSCLSPTYDKYLKTAISAYQNSLVDSQGDLKNPFGDFLPVYSNIKNGLGIFAGINSKKIPLK